MTKLYWKFKVRNEDGTITERDLITTATGNDCMDNENAWECADLSDDRPIDVIELWPVVVNFVPSPVALAALDNAVDEAFLQQQDRDLGS